MSVIIRLQNLPWTANALDIRRLFQGLSIPDGGVHIVGGDNGDAFIAFASDDDARKAMHLDGSVLMQHTIKLYLSSKNEMQSVIAVARGAASTQTSTPPVDPYTTRTPQPQQKPVVPGVSAPTMVSRNAPPVHSGIQQAYPDPESQLSRFDCPVYSGSSQIRPTMRDSQYSGPSSRAGPGSQREGRPALMPTPQTPPSEGYGPRPSVDRGFQRGPSGQEPMENTHWKGSDNAYGASAREGYFGRQENRRPEQHVSKRDNFDRNYQENSPYGLAENDIPMRAGPGDGYRGDRDFTPPVMQRGLLSPPREMNAEPEPPSYDRSEPRAERDWYTEGRNRPPRDAPLLDDPHVYSSRANTGLLGDGPRDMDTRDTPMRGPRDNDNIYRSRPEPSRRPALLDNPEPESVYPRDMRPPGGEFGPSQREEERGGYYDDDGRDSNSLMQQSYDREREPYFENANMYMDRNRAELEQEHIRDVREWNEPGNFRRDNRNRWDTPHDGRGDGFGDGRPPRSYDERSSFQEPFRDRSPLRRDEAPSRIRGNSREPMQSRPIKSKFGEGVPGCHVFVSNMPHTITYREVRSFFRGSPIPGQGLKLINDEYGERNGTAYIMFGDPMAAKRALEKSGMSIAPGYNIKIRPIEQYEFDAAIDSEKPLAKRPRMDASPIENCVAVKNIPYRTKRFEVKNYFANYRIASGGGPILEYDEVGRFTGNVVIEAKTRRDFEDLLALTGSEFNGRSIEVISISKKEFDKRVALELNKSKQEKREPARVEKSQSSGETSKGKEIESGKEKEKDVPKAKEAEKPKDTIKKDTKENIKDSKDGKPTGTNTDKPKPVPDNVKVKVEKTEVATDKKDTNYCVRLEGLPFSADQSLIKEFFGGLEIVQRGIHILYNDQRKAVGTAFVEFVSSVDCKKAVSKSREYIGKRCISVVSITKRDMLEEISKHEQQMKKARMGRHDRNKGPRDFGRAPYREHPNPDIRSRENEWDYGDDRRSHDERRVEYREYRGGNHHGVRATATVGMHNVSFRAQLNDILDFFYGFRIIPDSLQVHTLPDGRRTGEAALTLESPQEARLAAETLNGRELLGRPVEVFLMP